MAKIMIIGAGDFQLPLIEAVFRKNFEIVLVAPVINDNFNRFVSSKYFVDVREKEKILEIAKNEKINGVITDQTDIPVRTVAYVAEKMGLNGIGYETSKIFTDKSGMRKKLEELNIPVLPYKLISRIDEAISFYNENAGGIIIKPTDTQGSRGVVKVTDKSKLSAAFDFARKFSSGGKVLVEKYATGTEFVVEGVTDNYSCHNLICGDTVYFQNKSLFSAKKRTFPSQCSDNIKKRVLALNKRIVEGFKLPYGITHAEYIMDGDEIYLIEIAARGGGVFISSDLIYECTNFSPEEFLIKKSLSQPTDIKIADKNIFAGYRAFYLPTGIVEEAAGIEDVSALPFVRRHQLNNIHKGMVIGENTNKTSRFSVIVVADSCEQWEQRVAEIKNMLNIKVKSPDGSYNGIIWD